MVPRLTRGEYWLLETAVEVGPPVRYLAAPRLDQVFNKPGHGLDRASLVETLERLFQSGLVGVARLSEGGCSGPFSRALTRGEIDACLDEPGYGEGFDTTFYGLTAEGGRQWEQFAAPDWDRYIARYTRPSRSGRWDIGVIISPEPHQVDRLLEGARYMGQAIDDTHLHRRVVRPWQATYWKRLTRGYLASYRFDEVESNWDDAPLWFMKLVDNRQWYRWM